MAEKKTIKIAKKSNDVLGAVLEMMDELALEALVTLREEIETRIKHKQKEQNKELHAKMLEMARAAGFSTVEEFVQSQKIRTPRKDKGVKLPAKYRSMDGSRTWSGKGRKPDWFVTHLEKGGFIEELKIA